MGCPRSTTLAAALLYLAYYLRCCVKDLAVRSPAVGALAAHRMPAYLYRSNNDTKLLAHLARAATAGADEPAFLAPACAAGTPSFNALVKACVEIKILRRVRAESSRRPPRHRRDACTPDALLDFHTGSCCDLPLHWPPFLPEGGQVLK